MEMNEKEIDIDFTNKSLWGSYFYEVIVPNLINIWEGLKSLICLPIMLILMPFLVFGKWYKEKK